MNSHAMSVLEFRAALERVAARAGSPLGREAVRALTPFDDLEAAQTELARVVEAFDFLRAHPDWAPPAVPDARPALKVLGVEGGVLDSPGALSVARLLASGHVLRDGLSLEGGPEGAREEANGDESSAPAAHLTRLRERLAHRPRILEAVRKVVDDEGGVRDEASPRLRALRRKLRGARSRTVRELERFLESLPERIRVPDASVSIRAGRYVIPVRREGRSDVGGVIHGESGTGATLFVEPPVAIRLMNEIHELERDEAREVQRILRELTGRLREIHGELTRTQSALVDFDGLWARALSARAWEGSAPDLAPPDEGELRIVGGRHPLLLEQGQDPVVPFDLTLEPGERAVVVSGPNTGGKTVFLKAMGLLHLLAQSGVIPPVAPGTRFPVVRNVFADIGDEQSITESLSTYSAHLANALEILEGAGPGTLVLMDEMGTGTDPSEGAALARAILETLVERGARAIVTSHLGALKRLDAEGSGIVNASLLFDSRRFAPTYEMRKGRPGRSYGLAIARGLGMPEQVLERAEAYVDSGELEVESLLGTLEEKERELSRALEDARLARERAEALEREARSRADELEERERTAEARAREEARQLLLGAREEVEEAIRQLREADGETRDEAEREARRKVEEAARRQRERMPASPPPGRDEAPESLAPGDRVRVLGSGADGTVREIREERVTVDVGGLRLQVPVHEVELVEGSGRSGSTSAGGSGGNGTGGKRSASGPGGGGWTGPDLEGRPVTDLRGLRVDEVELELVRALDGAILANLPELRIIHGKGTGAVKARVLELLQEDGRVKEFRAAAPGAGGGGVTVARLR